MKKILAPILLAGLIGCTTAPITNQIEASSKAIQDTAVQIDRLQKSGQITNDREDALLDRLSTINQMLWQANSLASTCKPDCSEVQNQLTAINQMLIQLQAETRQ